MRWLLLLGLLAVYAPAKGQDSIGKYLDETCAKAAKEPCPAPNVRAGGFASTAMVWGCECVTPEAYKQHLKNWDKANCGETGWAHGSDDLFMATGGRWNKETEACDDYEEYYVIHPKIGWVKVTKEVYLDAEARFKKYHKAKARKAHKGRSRRARPHRTI